MISDPCLSTQRLQLKEFTASFILGSRLGTFCTETMCAGVELDAKGRALTADRLPLSVARA